VPVREGRQQREVSGAGARDDQWVSHGVKMFRERVTGQRCDPLRSTDEEATLQGRITRLRR
jgi:hypothetical protein